MNERVIHGGWLTAAAAGLLGLSDVGAQEPPQAGSEPEELIVTGSYIRGSNFQFSSPVDTFGMEEINSTNYVDITHFFMDLPYNTSSGVRGGVQDISRAKALGGGNIGFRGLGTSSVLVLLDGQRVTQHPNNADAQIDMNSIVPRIMIQRMEILKDGASSIYGSDAVGGVVNFITRSNFVGLEVDVRGNWITQNDFGADNWSTSVLWGAETSGLNIVVGAEIFQQDHQPNMTLKFDSGNVPGDPRNPMATSIGAPGNLLLPIRTATGESTGNVRTIPDPDCERNPGSFLTNNRCGFNFAPNSTAIVGEQRLSTMVTVGYDIAEGLRYKGAVNYTRVAYENVDTPSGNLSVPITIPGHNPGNTFRAVDANGNPLYAVPSGISMGYDKDGDGVDDFLPQRQSGNPFDLTSPVLLTANPTDPASGIPFWEDVGFNGRIIGSQGGLPTNGQLDVFAYNDIRPPTRTDQYILRVANGLEAEVNDWFVDFDVTWSEFDMRANVLRNNVYVDALRAALMGFGGVGCDPLTGSPNKDGCRYINIFGNAPFATPGTPAANTQEIIDFVMPALWDHYRSRLFTVEGVLSRDIFDVPAGTVALAVGAQYRKTWLELDFDALRNQGRTETGLPERDLDASRDTSAVFAELRVPVFDRDDLGSFEINASVRTEDSGGELRSTDPKIGAVYNTPGGRWTVRGSWGESFLSPSLFRLYTESSGLANVDDVPPSQGGTGQTLLRVQTVQRGDPNLRPQTSEARSFGFMVRPTRNLSLDVSYWDFDFRGLLAAESAQQVILSDPLGPRVTRDPVSNIPLIVETFFVNAARLATSGVDFQLDFSRQLRGGGDLIFNLLGTYVMSYDIQDSEDAPVVDGVGKVNELNFGDTSIEWRVNPRLTWSRGNHMITGVVKYASSLGNNGRREAINPKIKSWAPLDVTYRYRFGRGMTLSLGMQNVFDLQPEDEWGGTTNGRFPFGTQTFEGRIVWAGFTASF
ncbi:MAG TPA: TonB-dependent receptor [Gammaproteobacteria bacterium]